MQKIECRLTVFYDGSFWVGVYERVSEDGLEACRMVFGAEPKDYEVQEFLLQNWSRLCFSPPLKEEGLCRTGSRQNPKRRQRQVRAELKQQGAGTKSWQALQLLREENKRERQEKGRRQREEERQLRFEQRKQKKKEKHRGR